MSKATCTWCGDDYEARIWDMPHLCKGEENE
jgi:hypothetical protein